MCAYAGEILCIGAGAKPGAHPPPEHCLQRPKGMYYLMSVSTCTCTCTCTIFFAKCPIIGSSTVVDHETYMYMYMYMYIHVHIYMYIHVYTYMY